MTTSSANAGRALARLRKTFIITCEVCGEQVVKRDNRARICGSNRCRFVLRKRRERARKAEDPASIGEAQQ